MVGMRFQVGRLLPVAWCLCVSAAVSCDGEIPPPQPTLRVLVPGDATLVGYAANACSGGPSAPPTEHRWCAFYRLAPAGLLTELWVIDLTRVVSGQDVPCDGSSPACMRLTDNLFTRSLFGSPSHPEAHRFEGDTLFYLSGPNAATDGNLDRYEGLVWAWRPGWQRGRVLTTDRGVLCRGGENAAVAYCVDSVSGGKNLQFDLRAGILRDADEGPLPLVERLSPVKEGSLAWSADFSADGRTFAYSSWPDDVANQRLNVIDVARLGRSVTPPVMTIADDGRGWTLSPDGHSVYFVREGDRQQNRGDLWAADFPSGTAAARLATDIYSFRTLGTPASGDRGIAYMTNPMGLQGSLSVVPDRRHPEVVLPISKDVHFWFPSDDGRFAYILQEDNLGDRGLVADLGRGTICRPMGQPEGIAYSPTFLPNFGRVLWKEASREGGDQELAYLARPEDCGDVRPLGKGIDMVRSVGKEGLAYGTRDDSFLTAVSWVPHLDPAKADGLATKGLSVMSDSDDLQMAVVPFAMEGHEALVMTRSTRSKAEPGLFVFGPLP